MLLIIKIYIYVLILILLNIYLFSFSNDTKISNIKHIPNPLISQTQAK